MSYRVLLIGADGELMSGVEQQLYSSGHTCLLAFNGPDGLVRLRDGSLDLVVLLVPTPYQEAFALCRSIRLDSHIPIIALSARNSVKACVGLLGAGADDYVLANCAHAEMAARVEAAVRRANAAPFRSDSTPDRAGVPAHGVLSVGDIRLDLNTCRITVDNVVRTLTPNEFRLMAIFLRAPGEVFTREDLRKRVWPTDQHSLHLVEVHIANLRTKIERDPHHPTRIVTVRSRGYTFAPTA